MNLKEQLKAKKAELVALKADIEAGDKDAITKAGEIADAITELEASIAAAEKASNILKAIGTPEGEEVAENNAKSGMKSLQAQAKSVDRSKKGWSISANFKANTDVISSVQIADVDRSVEVSETKVDRIADLLPQARISGNAVTYFTEGEVEGEVAVTAEGAKKPQLSTSFEPTTEALKKIAGYMKETDEVLSDNDFLASAVEEVLLRKLVKKENNYVITAIGTGSTALHVVYDDTASNATQLMMEGILEAKSQIENDTDYIADIILMNPSDYFAMQTAKDQNGQYYGGGWASGAYGNGSYSSTVTPWGMRVVVSSDIAATKPVVIASDACKVYRKNDAAVRIYEQNEDDALYNRVTVLAEERLLAVVKNGLAVVVVEPDA